MEERVREIVTQFSLFDSTILILIFVCAEETTRRVTCDFVDDSEVISRVLCHTLFLNSIHDYLFQSCILEMDKMCTGYL